MKQILSNIYNVNNWLITWEYFFIGIPITFIIFIILFKIIQKEVLYEDLPLAFVLSLLHQYYMLMIIFCGPFAVVIYPLYLVWKRIGAWWDTVKEKRIF